jgi:hypothetical protein
MWGEPEYLKELGWVERDEHDEQIKATIAVTHSNYGFVVLRFGRDTCRFLHWAMTKEEAIEWAVDWARKEIAHNEIQECKKRSK